MVVTAMFANYTVLTANQMFSLNYVINCLFLQESSKFVVFSYVFLHHTNTVAYKVAKLAKSSV